MTYICPCFKYFTYNMHEKYSNLHFGFQTVVWKGLNLMGFLTLRGKKIFIAPQISSSHLNCKNLLHYQIVSRN